MAEYDVFERRLRAALVRHTDGGPVGFDALGFAREVAAREPRRHGPGAILGWRTAGVPRLAWVLLLAALLTALAVGALAVGSRLERKVPAIVPLVSQVYECPTGSTPDKPGPADQARPPEYAQTNTAVAFDRRAGRLVAVAHGVVGIETWAFDVCTNTWARMHPDREPPAFDGGHLVYDIDSDATVLVAHDAGWATSGTEPWGVWAYDLGANTWTERGAAPTIDPVFLAYDPVSGLVIAGGFSDLKELWTYDVDDDTWTAIARASGPDYAVIAYDASVDRLVAYADAAYGASPYETWLLDLRTGTWSRSGAERPPVVGWLTAPRLVYDEAAELTVVLQRSPVTAYDASADRWLTLPEEPATWPYAVWPYPGEMVYDAVTRRLIGLGQTSGTPDVDIPPGGVEALDPATGERTVLLERVGE